MGIDSFSDEYTSPIPPARIFKASIIDSHNLIPKLMPQAIKSIKFIQGNGGTGSIKQINFAGDSNFDSVKYFIDGLDERAFTYKYTLIEGEALTDKLEKITYDVKFEPTPKGGTISKVTSKYYTKGGFELKEDDIKAGKTKVLAMYEAVEAYLLKNPDAYV